MRNTRLFVGFSVGTKVGVDVAFKDIRIQNSFRHFNDLRLLVGSIVGTRVGTEVAEFSNCLYCSIKQLRNTHVYSLDLVSAQK